MSGLKLRGRAVAVAAITAIILPAGIMAAGSASAAGNDLLSPVTGLLGGATGSSIVPLDAVTGVLGGGSGLPTDAVTGILGGATSGDVAGTATGLLAGTPAAGALGTATGLVGGTPAAGAIGGVTGAVPGVVGTVTGLVPAATGLVGGVTGAVPGVVDTVTGLVGTVTGVVGGVVGGINTKAPATPHKAVKAAHKAKAKPAKVETVNTAALPHTGGDANATALLMCAGLAVAGAGVTLVTRRRNGMALHAAR